MKENEGVQESIAYICAATHGMPVRVMEKLISYGEQAVPSILAVLQHKAALRAKDPLLFVVVLGEIGSPQSIPYLIHLMERVEDDLLARTAMESLAKIGQPAADALMEVARTKRNPLKRLYAYAALGYICDERVFRFLLEALHREKEVPEVIAYALAEQQHPEAIKPIYEKYLQVDKSFWPEFEDALHLLLTGRDEPPTIEENWRLHYRRNPNMSWELPLTPVDIAVIVYRAGVIRKQRKVTGALKTLEEIKRAADRISEERCQNCDQPIKEITGLPVCPETAELTIGIQIVKLKEFLQMGISDVYDALDEVDENIHFLQLREGLSFGKEPQGEAFYEWGELQVKRQTLLWCVQQGYTDFHHGIGALKQLQSGVVERYWPS